MKFIKQISFLLTLLVAITSCERSYDAPPLNEPIYNGMEANTTIAQLKEIYSSATDKEPVTINEELILKAYITGNDEAGNIYKQIYVQDETGAMPIQIDEGSAYNYYRRGQEVFINLKGMCVSVYGDEKQLGWPEASSNYYRMPFTTFEEKVQKNHWPNLSNVEPEIVTDLSALSQDVTRMTFRMIKFKDVTFENGGKNTFATESGFGSETLKDVHGNTITVRTSNYSSFAYDKLPIGKGTVIAILGRFRGEWQLSISSKSDYYGFDGIAPDDSNDDSDDNNDGDNNDTTKDITLFSETFGTPAKVGDFYPKINEYEGFDNDKSMFYDKLNGLSARIINGDGNVWFTKGKEGSLTISDIKSQVQTNAKLVYKVGASVHDSGDSMDLNSLKVKCNGVNLSIPSKIVNADNGDENKAFEITIENINLQDANSLEFYTTASANTFGLRLFDVKLIVPGTGASTTPDEGENDDNTIYPTPSN